MKSKMKYRLISCASVLAVLVIWQLCTDVFHMVPAYSLPSPVRVLESFAAKLYTKAPDGSTLLQHSLTSLQISMTGFLLGVCFGVPLGILMGWYKGFDLAVKPIFDVFRPIPPIGWIPLMIIFLGIGLKAKAAVVFFAAFIPCTINVYTGIRQTNQVHLWVAKTFGASNLQMLFGIAIPTALPMMMTGIRISLSASWMTLVAAELLAATKGLGYMIQISRTIGRPDIILVGMVTMGLIGVGLSYILSRFEKMILKG